ncbi:MAG: hypothetical protein FWD11_09015, partial [Micrococcales bacterium]|nr:hypothetical protein [Micrococcales bacterium]
YAAVVGYSDFDVVSREFFKGVSPETGSPNVVVDSACGAVTGVDFTNDPPFTPDEADLVPGLAGKISAPVTATAGSTITVTVPGGHEGEGVYAYLFSDPIPLGPPPVVSSSGTIQVTLPAAITGIHRIAVYAASGILIGWDTVTIQQAGASNNGNDTGAGANAKGSGAKDSGKKGSSTVGRLARTGAVVLPVMFGAAVLVAAGLGLMVVRRRRRSL